MRTTVRVIRGHLAESDPHRTSEIEAAYQHFGSTGGAASLAEDAGPLRVDDRAVSSLARRGAPAGRSVRAAGSGRVLHRYVRLSSDRDIGPVTEWSGLIGAVGS
jgi:hypothetical protein